MSVDGSCRQAVCQVLTERVNLGEQANSVNTSSYCKARKNLPLEPIVHAVSEIGKALHEKAELSWCWKGHNTLIVDGTTVLMQDTPSNQQAFPQQSNQKTGLGFPIARIVGLISLSTGSVVSYAKGSYQGKGNGETSLFSTLFSDIPSNDILLADRYYCTWAIIALLIKQGSHILVQNHAQRKPNYAEGEILGAKDHLTQWQKPIKKPVWMSTNDYLNLPEKILIREFAKNGINYVTTLLDGKVYHKKALSRFYKERWKIELDFRSIKTNMGMEMLRCKSADMVRKEVAINFLSYNLIRANIACSAIKHNAIPRQLSYKTAVQLFSEIKILLISQTGEILNKTIHNLLKSMSTISIGKQKRKNQPRAIKRRPKAYPLLTVPREEACNALNIGVVA